MVNEKYLTIFDKYTHFNKSNYNELSNILKNKLIEYKNLLKKLKYEDWIEYIKKNDTINYKGYTYYFFLYEYLKDKDKLLINEPYSIYFTCIYK